MLESTSCRVRCACPVRAPHTIRRETDGEGGGDSIRKARGPKKEENGRPHASGLCMAAPTFSAWSTLPPELLLITLRSLRTAQGLCAVITSKAYGFGYPSLSRQCYG